VVSSLLYPRIPFWPYKRFVLRLNPCLGGDNANHGFRGLIFVMLIFPSDKEVASSSIVLKPAFEISSVVIFL